MKTHIGKIGRLKSIIRDEVNQRIEDGQTGVEILSWLNGLSEVQRVLQEQFGGRPISKQNLSHWRNSGHVEWLQRQDRRLSLQSVTERAETLSEGALGRDLGQQFATILTAEIALLGMDLLRSETNAQRRWRRLCDLRRQLTRLRREDQQMEELAFQRDKQARVGQVKAGGFPGGRQEMNSAKNFVLANLPEAQPVAKAGVALGPRISSCRVQRSPTQSKQKI
jgi:hypothetical protein